MGNTTVKQKQKQQVDSVEQEDEITVRSQKQDDTIEDSIPQETIQEVLEAPVLEGPVTSEDTDLSTSEKEETGHEMADMASRLSSAIEEKDDKLG